MTGKIFLVATPIGNLADMTLRALETLRAVPLIAAEDTRRTRALLSHFEITGKVLIACNAYADEAALNGLVARVQGGEDLAFVTDAGTSSVSDPGTALVRACVRAGLELVPIPGVSAVTTAVAVSGLVDGPFCFLGFLPNKAKKREQAIERIAESELPCVLFEAPHRMQKTLDALSERMPERKAVLCRELTKLYEELRRGTLLELAQGGQAFRGEITLVIAAAEQSEDDAEQDPAELENEVLSLLRAGVSARSVVEELSERTTLSRRELYRKVTELSELVRAETAPDSADEVRRSRGEQP